MQDGRGMEHDKDPAVLAEVPDRARVLEHGTDIAQQREGGVLAQGHDQLGIVLAKVL